jgi:hypothetical protein
MSEYARADGMEPMSADMSGTRCETTPHEPSAWLRGAAARRVRQIAAAVLDVEAYGVVVAPLGSSGPPGSREDRSCDRCGRYVPERDLLHLLTYQPTPRIHLAGGLCGRCAAKEGAR